MRHSFVSQSGLPVLTPLTGCAVGAAPSPRLIAGHAAAPASYRGKGAAPTDRSCKIHGYTYPCQSVRDDLNY